MYMKGAPPILAFFLTQSTFVYQKNKIKLTFDGASEFQINLARAKEVKTRKMAKESFHLVGYQIP